MMVVVVVAGGDGPAAQGSGRLGRWIGLVLDENFDSFVELLALHPPVLEPDLDLPLGEVELAGDLPPLLTGDVRVADELVLQDHRLVAGVGLPFLTLPGLLLICWGEERSGWVDGLMDGWIYGWMDEYMGGWIDGWMNIWVGRWMGGWMDGWFNWWINKRIDGWMDVWMDVWMDGYLGG